MVWGRKLPFSYVKSSVQRLWGNEEIKNVLATDEGQFFFVFNSKNACDQVFEGGPWHIAGPPIILKKWHKGLKLSTMGISKIPIWVKFLKLPMEYWTEEGLSFVASMVGKPLHVDKVTATCERITYARACIEIDVEDDLISGFDLEIEGADNEVIDVIPIKIEYQWVPSKCKKCKTFGHDCDKPTPKNVNTRKPTSWVAAEKQAKQPEVNTKAVVPPTQPAHAPDTIVDRIQVEDVCNAKIENLALNAKTPNSFQALSTDELDDEDYELESASDGNRNNTNMNKRKMSFEIRC